MKNNPLFPLLVAFAVCTQSRADWTAFNDQGQAGNANDTSYTIPSLGTSSGTLKNISTGAALPVILTITTGGTGTAPGGSGAMSSPASGTFAATAFSSYIDWTAGSNPGAHMNPGNLINYTFTGLDPNKRYRFTATSTRGGSGGDYPARWTQAELLGAVSYTPAHTANVITSAQFPSGLSGNQVAWNAGINLSGDMVEWDDIAPAADGSFTVRSSKYSGIIPGGGTASGPYSYLFQAIRIEEYVVTGPHVQITTPANNSMVVLPADVLVGSSISGFAGAITNVSIYNNSSLLGNATSPPFNFTWTNATPGACILRAVASDNTGLTHTSAPVTIIVKGNIPPSIAIANPANGAVLSAPADLQIDALAFDADGQITNIQYFANGTQIAQKGNSSFLWPSVPAGTYNLFAIATDDRGASTTSSVVQVFVIKSTAPTVDSFTPAPGTVSNLTQITVNFSTPVAGVNASDLLINSIPATSVAGSNSMFTFTFPTPLEGSVAATWAPNHGIIDFEVPPKPLDGTHTNETAQYTLVDSIPPVATPISPVPGAVVPTLAGLDISFSEPVSGVEAWDLLINGIPATKVTGSLAGPYHFTFAQPPPGLVSVSWAASHAIHDFALARNALTPTNWTYTLDITGAQNNIVISEIMFHPATDRTNDQYIELHNTGFSDVNLLGWKFSKGIPFAFPNVSIPANGYLVIAADLTSFNATYPDVANVIGGWSGWMSSHLELKDATGKTINEVRYGSSGDWGLRERGAVREKVTSITRNGSTATVTMPGNYSNGDTFTVTGADQPEYNGTFVMSGVARQAPNASISFNYTVQGTPVSPATGLIICRQTSDCGHTGWTWTSLADGLGSSLELASEILPNQYGQNWKFSVAKGTPGKPNSAATANLAPMILDVRHFPLVPTSTNPVTIIARLLDEQTASLAATLYWRVDASPTNGFSAISMSDDGLHGDGAAADGLFAATIPPQANNTVVEFYVEARDLEGALRTWPAPANDTNDLPIQAANALYQVDNTVYSSTNSQPMFRLILRDVDRAELASFPGSSPWSNCKFNLTMISLDGVDSELRYLSGVRDRGAGTRQKSPCNHEIDFTDDQPWHGLTSLNLNTQYTESQMMGHVLAMLSGLDTEAARVVQVRVNNANRASSGSPQFGSYIQLERTDNRYVKNHWPGEAGNIYRGQSSSHACNLTYHGDAATYLDYAKDGYSKQNNTIDNDWSDLINLCRVLSITNVTDDTYEQNVRAVVDVEQWMRYMAVFNMSASIETAFATGVGDDYSLYRRSKDNRWILMAHDWDTILGDGDTTGQTNMPLFIMCPSTPFSTYSRDTQVLERFMKHPQFAPIYYKELKRLSDSVFSPAQMNETLDQTLGSWVPTSTISNMKLFNSRRWAYVVSQIPLNLTVSTALTQSNTYWRATNASLKLTGQANVVDTRKVTVNGTPSTWSAWEGRWTNTFTLTPGLNHMAIESLDASGRAFASTNFTVWYDTGTATPVGGVINSGTVWTAASSPYSVTSNLTIGSGATLTIEPGTTVYISSNVNLVVANGGRLLAEGTAEAPIHFTSRPESPVSWGGMIIDGVPGSPETRISHALIQGNGTTGIEVAGGTLYLDHTTFLTTTHQYLALDSSSFLLSRCYFPTATAQFELLHGTGGIKAGGRGIVRECYFGNAIGYNDIMDFTGGNRDSGQPIIQYYNNVFVGASDDILDLDGTDAWIEGNIFLHSHRNGSPDSSSAISGGSNGSSTSEVTIIGNIFFDCDDVATAKEGNFFTLLNNTIVHITKSGGLDFASGVVNERDTTPDLTGITKGFYLEGNIIWDIEQLVRNYDATSTTVTFTNNILPLAWSGPGAGNTIANPLLKHIPQVSETTNFVTWELAQVMRDWFSLQAASPAIATGPNGRDKGAVVPLGASISGEPDGTTRENSATLVVGSQMSDNGIPANGFPNGSGFTHYKWRLDKGAWSTETPTSLPISLTNLPNGLHTVSVIGKNDAGYYQNDPALGEIAGVTSSRLWIVNTNAPAVRLNEVLAKNMTAVPVAGAYPDLIELQNWSDSIQDLAGISITDDLASPGKFIFPAGTVLNPGEYMVLYADKASIPAGFHLGFGLKQEGAAVYLFTPEGRLLDSVVFGQQISDLSIGRQKDGRWTLTQPTFGSDNIPVSLGDPHNLKINEWLASGSALPPFVELFNRDPLPVSLGGLLLTDNLIGAPAQHQVAELSYIPGGGYMMFLADGIPSSGPNHLNFTLSADRGQIGLSDTDLSVIDAVLYGPQSTGTSQGRSPSGSSSLAFFATPTPNSPNSAPVPPGGHVVINEILTKNITGLTNFDGSTPDWIELYNPASTPLVMTDMSLSDDPMIPRKWAFPLGVTIPAQGYLVVACDSSRAILATNSPLLTAGFNLKESGGSVYLFDNLANGGALLDGVTYGIQTVDYSIGRVSADSTNWVLNLPSPGGINIAARLGDPMQLKINEWMANPSSGGKWFELYNYNAQPVDLSGLSIRDDSHQFTVAPLSFIGAGLSGYTRFWLDKDTAAGPDHVSFGVKASGSVLGIFTFDEFQIDYINFGPQDLGVSQGRLPDGSSTIVRFPATPTPGEANYLPLNGIVINEVLSAPATNLPAEQAIELFNSSPNPIDISGWFLGNLKYDLMEFRIPDGTIVPAGGYVVFYGVDFNFESDGSPMIWIDANRGDHLYLSQALPDGTLTGYRAVADFGPAESGVSFGRYTNSIGQVDFVAMGRMSFGVDDPSTLDQFRAGKGAPNPYPLVGPIVINEIMFHPSSGLGTNDNTIDEFLELLNTSSNTVPLFDPITPTNTWKLLGDISYAFPPGVSLPPSGLLLLVNFDPATNVERLVEFRARYNLDSATRLFGPYGGHLANSGGSLELYKPVQPQVQPIPGSGAVPYVLVEQIKYSPYMPWPTGADATGASLQRQLPGSYGNDPTNWFVALPTAGQTNHSTLADANGDGLPDAWQVQNFGSMNNPDATPAADPDHDGSNNLQEYFAGTSPVDPLSYLKLELVRPAGNSSILQFTAVSGKSYSVLYRESLTTGQWIKLSDFPPQAGDHIETVNDPAMGAARARFYILVTPQLPGN